MPTYFARANGNINGAIWATTPSGTGASQTFASGDVLMANGFTVTVNVSTDLGATGEVRNDTFGSASAGGGFTVSNGTTLTASVFAGSATCVTLSGTVSATIVGNITAGSGVNAFGVSHNSSGLLTVIGAVSGGSGAGAQGLPLQGGGSLSLTGNVSGGSGATTCLGVNNASGGQVTITGNVAGGSGNANNEGVRNSSTGSLTITGTVSPGTAAPGSSNQSTGTVTVVGSVVGGAVVGLNNVAAGTVTVTRAKGGPLAASAVGLSNSTTGVANVDEIEYGDLGASPTSGPIRLADKTSNVAVMYRFNTTKKTLVDVTSTSLLPAASDVRSGVSYGSGARTGTLAVPAASLVAAGTAVDNTTGTAAITSSAIQSACDAALTAFSSGRLANVATVASTGQQLADAVSQ